ncbi:unnamed protein product [Angiostrongylus costaricensis]|uniref:CMP/dCMP-type deaminase domain-containing protein n=1 Tax=Angiostrongylus costaricensis TaxID=334426 RepID=A0A0R3PC97_ANGCS|nr:unnamed protein product [Angiostrongylus costaricensis]
MADVAESHDEDRKFMKRAFQLAQEALDNDEVPVGCVFTYNGVEVGYGRNEVNCTKNPTAHAEMVALCRMQRLHLSCMIENQLLSGFVRHDMTTLGISKIVYGAANERFGGIKSVGNSLKYNLGESNIEVSGADQSIALLKSFYTKQNPFVPEEKRKVKKLVKCDNEFS